MVIGVSTVGLLAIAHGAENDPFWLGAFVEDSSGTDRLREALAPLRIAARRDRLRFGHGGCLD